MTYAVITAALDQLAIKLTVQELDGLRRLTDAHDFSTRFKALAQELQDIIFGLVALDGDPGTISITKEYKPPVIFHLNRKLRAQYTAKYYSKSEFIFEDVVVNSSQTSERGKYGYEAVGNIGEKWMASLEEKHQGYIRTLHFKLSGFDSGDWKTWGEEIIWDMMFERDGDQWLVHNFDSLIRVVLDFVDDAGKTTETFVMDYFVMEMVRE